ncbi:MAG: putative porin [Gammaproteobacteria bacterium]|nr:putative porin [Gammaproteobacteria bacterium]NVK88841.1 putative porin [Gammaproteobacteria bacterium]
MKIQPTITQSVAVVALALSSSWVAAEDYVSFSNLGFSHATESDVDLTSIGTRYFFDKKSTKGPLQEFDYLNTVSNVYAIYGQANVEGPNQDTYSVGGEWFIGRFLVGASHTDNDVWESTSVDLGYLFAPNFLVKVELLDDDSERDFLMSARYEHSLDNNRYIGFNVEVDDEMDTLTLSSKYFTPLQNGEYLTVFGEIYSSDVIDDSWFVGSEYYFNKHTSVGAKLGDEAIGINASHFFDNNLAVRGEIISYDNDLIGESISVEVAYQF